MNALIPLVQTPTRHRFTVDEVMRMVEVGLIDRDARYELMDGDLIDTPSEGELHLNYKILLNRFFVESVTRDLWVAPDATLHLGPTDAPEPDVYIVAAGVRLKVVDPANVHLVIEIADSSVGYDLGRKAAKYAAYALGEYWVVDVGARCTHVLRTPENGAYQQIASVAFDQPLTPTRLPDIALVIADLDGLPQGEGAARSGDAFAGSAL
jgi:Uma2 family endonuclease